MRQSLSILLLSSLLALYETCNMDDCFDKTLCGRRKVYIHPVPEEFETISPTSTVYQHILKFIKNSEYFTEDPNDACLFLLGLDTTDRDPKSHNYVKNINAYIDSLGEAWNRGKNHLIFNFYHGTYPEYREELGFDSGNAILARASANVSTFRKGFDISIPLFHDNHPYEIEEQHLDSNLEKKYLLSFKGKRYVYGIGSNTRNVVHHLHDGTDIIMITTCKHNNDWQNYQDERCEKDNELYDRWDYDDLLQNSTFCLVPRGRRLGSFRFLEVMRTGCIPVVISDGWELPFGNLIDWSAAAVSVKEAESLLTAERLMTMPRKKLRERKEATAKFYQKYLRSIAVITETALNIIFDRAN